MQWVVFLDALAAADVLLLGGGYFSELAASLGPGTAVKLAPQHVWDGMLARVPGAAAIDYPSGELSPHAAAALAGTPPSELRD